MTPRDSTGRTLTDPRPSVAVDVALLTVLPGPPARLAVLVHPREDGTCSLPGTFLHPGERLRDAALRALAQEVGVTGESPEQLRVFDEPGRDPRGWVLSVTHVDLVPASRLADRLPAARLAPVGGEPVRVLVDGEPTHLAFDHDVIVEDAVRWARSAYATAPDPRGLLGERFTLSELRHVHEAVRGAELQRDTFRRAMEGQVEPTGEVRRGTVGKPARVFRRVTPAGV